LSGSETRHTLADQPALAALKPGYACSARQSETPHVIELEALFNPGCLFREAI
jgi:hypothetical protein